MEKRRLEVTTRPTWQFSAEGRKVFMREVPEVEEETPITDFAIRLLRYIFTVTGWVVAFVLMTAG